MFLNHKSILVNDSRNNLYNYIWTENKIVQLGFDGKSDKAIKDVIAENCTDQFDIAITNDDEIHIVFQQDNGTLLLGNFNDEGWEINSIADEFEAKIFNLNLIAIEDELHFIYCVHSLEDNNIYRLFHHILKNDEWDTYEVTDFSVDNILNPFQIIVSDNKLILGYYDLKDIYEQVYIKSFDIENRIWNKEILVTDNEKKLYLDMILTEDNTLHITYSKFIEGNYIVNYERHFYKNEKLEKIDTVEISSHTNCSYPTLIKYKDKLWNIWTEYDYIASCYSEDSGKSWSNPYMWKNSKKVNFIRYQYKCNDREDENYNLNHSFGKEHPKYTFIGFGRLHNTEEMPLKKKSRKI